MLFISPPFGNYLSLPKTTSIRGSFTLNERPGKWLQIAKTLRYKPLFGGWVNKIGLRNPGIDYAIKTYKSGEIISIAIMEQKELPILLKKIPEDMDIELNISCPNTEKHMINNGVSKFLNNKRKWCILKLSPIENFKNIDRYYYQGFRQFHCSNTIPTPLGGLSGIMIRYHNIILIKYIKNKFPDTEIIAGGGIQSMEDIKFYNDIGSDHYSISSLLFSPIKSLLFFKSFYFRDKI